MARKSKEPFVPVNRSFFESDYWLSETFTPAQAWLDLNYLAAYEKTVVIDGRRSYELEIGQVRTTLDKLAKRWNWNKKRVWEQLRVWKGNGMVNAQGNARGYTLTIENYGFVGLYGNAQGNAQGNTEGNGNVTLEGTPNGISSIYTRNKKLRNKEGENEDIFVPYRDPKSGMKVIEEVVDRKTGEEYVKVRI